MSEPRTDAPASEHAACGALAAAAILVRGREQVGVASPDGGDVETVHQQHRPTVSPG
jgi:hypothetical protein